MFNSFNFLPHLFYCGLFCEPCVFGATTTTKKMWKTVILNMVAFFWFLLQIKVSHKSNSSVKSQSASQPWVCYFFLLLILLTFALFAFLSWTHGFRGIISSLTISCQIFCILESLKVSVQWNENGPLDDGAKELLPQAIIANYTLSQVSYWQWKWQLSFSMSDEFEQN